jgi:uncharacterized membrane protein YgcG
VTNAVTSVVDAITPSAPVGPKTQPPQTTDRPSVEATPPGQATAAAVRSASAALQVQQNLDKAAAFLAAGKDEAAAEQLNAAQRKLALVLDPSMRAKLGAELSALRARLASPRPARSPGAPADKGSSSSKGGNGADARDHGKKGGTTGTSSSGRGSSGQRTGGQSGDGHGSVGHTPAAIPTHNAHSAKTSTNRSANSLTNSGRGELPSLDGKNGGRSAS